MTATVERLQLTDPGVYDLTAAQYHRDPVAGGSLSSSGIKLLMPPNCPAKFKHWRENGSPHKRAFDFGHAAHAEVLGVGEEVVVVDARDWKTKKAQEDRDAAYAAGKVPLLVEEYERVRAMATELRRHPAASALLDPTAGDPERTLIWRDPETGVMCRMMTDWLRRPVPGQRYILADFKTSEEVDPASIQKAMWNFGYYGQAGWYSEAIEQLGLSDGPPAFVFIFQRKYPPHLVTCVQLHPDDIARGHERNRKARHLYRTCVEQDRWPGYADDHILPVQLPTWARYQHDGASERGEFEPEGATL